MPLIYRASPASNLSGPPCSEDSSTSHNGRSTFCLLFLLIGNHCRVSSYYLCRSDTTIRLFRYLNHAKRSYCIGERKNMQQMQPTYFFDTPSNYNGSSAQPTWYYPGHGASSCRTAPSSYTTQQPFNRHQSVQHIRYSYDPHTRPFPMDGMQEQFKTTSLSNQAENGTWQHGFIDRKQPFHNNLEILGITSAVSHV
ncbi:hypothetical protein BDZ85DRAFT_91302 [Elsinoe ampelina]|uniref:Uncharacterized protein n=1 Tax=Elsinoe ampelina TaxID=302913 RepID=A0A6A6GI56_9PEZI|nr:hypothetical protein BDZ85DRAFT_91302 [Elsinoe ampelina]